MNDTLPSWHDTPTKQAIIDFVAAVTDEAGPGYVPPAGRIAVFDNDGTLWCEKPMVIQMDFLLRKLAAQAESDPALRLLIVHDDGEREFEYSAGAEKALGATQSQGWTAVSMQRDWRQAFPG